ncbi:MAG TPA: hypothetical protein VFF65_09515 [Phycisphaerales bacterium]|nr:hypothetical protein [Phycisphaerales bacterium]
MPAPKNNLGGGATGAKTPAAKGTDARPPADTAPIVMPSTDDADLKLHIVAETDTPEAAAGKVERLRAVTSARAAAAFAAAKAVAAAKKTNKGVAEAEKEKAGLDALVVTAGAVLDASNRLAKRIAAAAGARVSAEDAARAADRKERFHTTSEALDAARGSMEAEFKAVEKTMADKRAEVARIAKDLRRSFNMGEWGAFDAAVKAAGAFADAQGEAGNK